MLERRVKPLPANHNCGILGSDMKHEYVWERVISPVFIHHDDTLRTSFSHILKLSLNR
jgi:hypothetical protein